MSHESQSVLCPSLQISKKTRTNCSILTFYVVVKVLSFHYDTSSKTHVPAQYASGADLNNHARLLASTHPFSTLRPGSFPGFKSHSRQRQGKILSSSRPFVKSKFALFWISSAMPSLGHGGKILPARPHNFNSVSLEKRTSFRRKGKL